MVGGFIRRGPIAWFPHPTPIPRSVNHPGFLTKSIFLLAFSLCALPDALQANITVGSLFTKGLVLQRSEKVPVWGKASPGEQIDVTIANADCQTTADETGSWMAVLDLHDVPGDGPFELVVKGVNEIRIPDVLIGEVWFASGQSNMQMSLEQTEGAESEMAQSDNTWLRMFKVKNVASPTPREDPEGQWVAASPRTTPGFTAVGYYFGKKLQKELSRPVGIINASWGGTPSESWTSREGLSRDQELHQGTENRIRAVEAYPEAKRLFDEAFKQWSVQFHRTIPHIADVSEFAGESMDTSAWIPIQLPGQIVADGLPASGMIWLRREVESDGGPLNIQVPIDGLQSLYWNGTLLKELPDYPGPGQLHKIGPIDIPKALIRPGKNALAVRLYVPTKPAKVQGELKAGSAKLDGTWLARAEQVFPPLPAEGLAAVPIPPTKVPDGPYVPSSLFQGMVAPVMPYAIRGVIWYQGEGNAGRAFQYRSAFPSLIQDWRKHWGRGDFPFYHCQLAGYLQKTPLPEASTWAELREAQSLALSLPNTGQAVLIDLGEAEDIHPRNKRDVGERLAAIALANDYGVAAPYSGPVLESARLVDGKAILTFKHAEGGLVARELPTVHKLKTKAKATAPLLRNSPKSQLEGFAICGEDRKWTWAQARIEGAHVLVWSETVPVPVAVRYAWANNPTCNLYNGAGFPASPFRTDDFPMETQNARY